jgi:hypothetical protein
MTGSDALHILFGAALVAIGVIAAAVAPALADRIRHGRTPREATTRERAPREKTAHAARTAIPVVEPADLLRASAPKAPRAPRNEPKVVASTDGGDDVIAALVAAGYKKPIATEATWACSSAERTTVESWTAAALRRCARGGMS